MDKHINSKTPGAMGVNWTVIEYLQTHLEHIKCLMSVASFSVKLFSAANV